MPIELCVLKHFICVLFEHKSLTTAYCRHIIWLIQIILVYVLLLQEIYIKTKHFKLRSTTLRFGHLEFHLKLGFTFWRVNHNSRFRVNRQMNFAHAHFKNRWSGFPIWMFENHMMLNSFLYDFYKLLQKQFKKDCNFFCFFHEMISNIWFNFNIMFLAW